MGASSDLTLLAQVLVLESDVRRMANCSDLTLFVQLLELENKNGVVVSSKIEATVFFSALI
jgi:hypothetical protein